MQERISVVVPVYKTQRYLRKCLDSILNQTYPNIEIVVVNDCSPDDSAEICREYAEKYDQVKYIELEHNVGLSSARNAGIEVATGDYLGFVDSDDWVEPEAYELLYRLMKKLGITFIGNPFGSIGTNDVCEGVYTGCPSHSCKSVDCARLVCTSHHCDEKSYISSTGLDDSDEDG